MSMRLDAADAEPTCTPGQARMMPCSLAAAFLAAATVTTPTPGPGNSRGSRPRRAGQVVRLIAVVDRRA